MGCDHGARQFRADLHLLFQSSTDDNVKPCSISLHVGHIDCTKDTREVLQKILAAPLNDSLKQLMKTSA
jgi:hypothetical protein